MSGVRCQVLGGVNYELLIINCKLKKYLLENYPLIWNTKLLPMLGLAACGHVFSFCWAISLIKAVYMKEFIP